MEWHGRDMWAEPGDCSLPNNVWAGGQVVVEDCKKSVRWISKFSTFGQMEGLSSRREHVRAKTYSWDQPQRRDRWNPWRNLVLENRDEVMSDREEELYSRVLYLAWEVRMFFSQILWEGGQISLVVYLAQEPHVVWYLNRKPDNCHLPLLSL